MKAYVRAIGIGLIVAVFIGLLAIPGSSPARARAGEPVVARIYFEDRDHLNEVAGALDIWEVHGDDGYVVAALTPGQYEWLDGLGYRLEIDAEKTEMLGIQAPLDSRFHYYDPFYPNPNGRYIVSFLQEVHAFHPDLTELYDIGNAWLGEVGGEYNRDMWVLRITNEDPAFGPIEDKPAFFLFANIHAREVATPELVIRYIRYLTDGYDGEGGYGVDPDATWLVDHNVLYALVMQNPDGHWKNEENTSNYRRKNMDSDDGCTNPDYWGVDLNRNSSFLWGCCGGSSGYPCDETYRGPAPASEPETQAFQEFFATVMLDQNGDNGDDEVPPAAPDDTTGIFISLHQYGDVILWPWYLPGYPDAPNEAQMEIIGRKLAHFTDYEPTGVIGYTVDGSTTYWTYGKFGIPSFTYEVAPNYGSCGGFFPDYECIDGEPGWPENFWAETGPSFVYSHKIARTPYMTSNGPDTQNVVVMPDEVPQGTPVALSANIADHRYYGDPLPPIAGAEYFIDTPGVDGTGIPMSPTDGSWGETSEDVEAVVNTAGLSEGRHYILVHGQNNSGDWGPFTAVFLDVTPGSVDTMHVEAIKMRHLDVGGGRYLVYAVLRIVDEAGAPLVGANVSAEWTLPDDSTQDQQALTNNRGLARFRVKSLDTGTFGFCVTDVVLDGYMYDPDQNGETCDTWVIP